MRILILGGTSFLGSAVVDAGIARGHAITTYTRGQSDGPRRPPPGLRGDRTSAEDLDAGVQPWGHLPVWLPEEFAATAWQVGTDRARQLGLRTRPIDETVRDTWRWLRKLPEVPVKEGVPRPGLPPEVERELLAASS